MNILVVDDHRLFADGLGFIFQRVERAVQLQCAMSGEQALSLCDAGYRPDLILLDLNLPGASGLSLIRTLRERAIWAPILMISASQSLSHARAALEQGAQGYICKTAGSDELLVAIDQVATGEEYLPEGWEQLLEEGPPQPEEPWEEGARITARKLEVLHLVAQGYPNKLIAHELTLSENTVKVHLRELFRALRVTNRTACVREAKRLGLIEV